MREITIKLYTYAELSDEAKRRAREWYKKEYVYDENPQSLHDGTIHWFRRMVGFLGFSVTEGPWWAIFCQGSHFAFGGRWDRDDIQAEKFKEYYGEKYLKYLDVVQTVPKEVWYANVEVNRVSLGYSRSEVTAVTEAGEEFEEEGLQGLVTNICAEMEHLLEEESLYQTSDEYLEEALLNNGYEFFADGTNWTWAPQTEHTENDMYEIEEITRYKVEGVVKGRRLLRTGPRTLDGKPATPITQFVVTRDGEQISEAYATREEAEEELALRRNARKG